MKIPIILKVRVKRRMRLFLWETGTRGDWWLWKGADETFDATSNQWWEYDAIENIRELAWKGDKNVEPMRSLNWVKIWRLKN